MTSPPAEKFPKVFWTANVTELFERAAYCSMASFVVIYLGQLGFGDYWPSFLNSTVLWGLVYFLPILSGTISDQVGFRRSLLAAFVLLACGYFLMGYPVWFGGSSLVPTIERHDDPGGGRGLRGGRARSRPPRPGNHESGEGKKERLAEHGGVHPDRRCGRGRRVVAVPERCPGPSCRGPRRPLLHLRGGDRGGRRGVLRGPFLLPRP